MHNILKKYYVYITVNWFTVISLHMINKTKWKSVIWFAFVWSMGLTYEVINDI